MRYEATFRSGNMELENEADDPQPLRQWIACLLGEYPAPSVIFIIDTEEHKVIFEEKNDTT